MMDADCVGASIAMVAAFQLTVKFRQTAEKVFVLAASAESQGMVPKHAGAGRARGPVKDAKESPTRATNPEKQRSDSCAWQMRLPTSVVLNLPLMLRGLSKSLAKETWFDINPVSMAPTSHNESEAFACKILSSGRVFVSFLEKP